MDGKFGKGRDTMYIVTMKNGDTMRIPAFVCIHNEGDGMVYFHSNNISSTQPVAVKYDDILIITNNGKVTSPITLGVGILCGGAAGGAVGILMRHAFTTTITNPIMRKIFLGTLIAGTAVVVGSAVGNALEDQMYDLKDKCEFLGAEIKHAIEERKAKKNAEASDEKEDKE